MLSTSDIARYAATFELSRCALMRSKHLVGHVTIASTYDEGSIWRQGRRGLTPTGKILTSWL